MSVAATPRVDLALGGSYRQEVRADNPVGWWRFAERLGTTVAADSSGNGRTGTITGGVTLEVPTDVTEGGYAFTFNGSTGYVTMGDVAIFEFTSGFSVEFWIKKSGNPGAPQFLVSKYDLTATTGWRVTLTTTGAIRVTHRNAAGTADAFLTTGGTVCDGLWHHVVCTWDGTTAANGVKVYVDGAVTDGTAVTASVSATNDAFLIGANSDLAQWFAGSLDEVAVYNGTLTATRVAAHRAAGLWTDVTEDVSGADGEAITSGFGIGGNGPKDRLADLGVMTFALNNSANNSAGLAGYYSPVHSNCRSGFVHGVACRLTYTYSSVVYPRFYGKVFSIDPAPGIHGQRRTHVVVHDLMDDLIEADIRNVTLQIDQTEAQLIATLFGALPVSAQPMALSLDPGLDISPYAFDKLGAGQKAIAPLGDLAISSIGYVHMGPDGAARYENRQARQVQVSSMTLADDMVGLVVPTSLDGVYNHVRATYHDKVIDAAATTVLWSQTGIAPLLAVGQSIDIWGDYYKAAEPSVLIGGTEQIAPAATTDYLGNTLADGTGTNKTAALTVTATFFASSVKFTITNTDPGPVYLTKLQARGKGLYDLSPVTVESVSVQPYGDRAINIDLPYQSSFNVTQDLAVYVRAQYETLSTQANSVTFSANRSGAFMLGALGAAIGDRITISETQTGVTLVDTFINHILLSSIPGRAGAITECQLGLASATFFGDVWILDDAALSLLGTSTILGYA